jgi:hypothetical protein
VYCKEIQSEVNIFFDHINLQRYRNNRKPILLYFLVDKKNTRDGSSHLLKPKRSSFGCLGQGLKNVTERNETVLTVFFQKRNETKRKIFEKMRNENRFCLFYSEKMFSSLGIVFSY